MATTIEPVVISRSISISLAPCASSSFCAVPRDREDRSLARFNGLKIEVASSRRGLVLMGKSKNGGVARGGGRIVCETQEAAVLEVTEPTWKSLVLESGVPVLVEFWAPWCGPCRMIHPVIDELAQEFTGKLKCYKLNTDESPTISSEYGIRSIPTVILFKKGEKKDAVVGAVPKTTLVTCFEKFL